MLSIHTRQEKFLLFIKMLCFLQTYLLLIFLQLTYKSICIFQLAEDVICHKADLRFVSISGQKVLDSVQGALEQVGGSDPALESTKQLVTNKLQDANHRYTTLHTKVRDTKIAF